MNNQRKCAAHGACNKNAEYMTPQDHFPTAKRSWGRKKVTSCPEILHLELIGSIQFPCSIILKYIDKINKISNLSQQVEVLF